jgi:hypothetical protein
VNRATVMIDLWRDLFDQDVDVGLLDVHGND